jgi:hypothetical protein
LNIVKREPSYSTIQEQDEEQMEDDEKDPDFAEVEESAMKVMQDISSKKIFDDILIDFDSILVGV